MMGMMAMMGDPATIGDPGEAKIIEEWSNIDAHRCDFVVFCGGLGLGDANWRRGPARW